VALGPYAPLTPSRDLAGAPKLRDEPELRAALEKLAGPSRRWASRSMRGPDEVIRIT
jgi:hypothetical protein